MSNFWPLIMWCYDVKAGVAWYKPSHAHHHGQVFEHHKTWTSAFRYAQRKIGPLNQTRVGLPMSNNLPTYIPWVIEQKKKPDTGAHSTLRLRVERIAINEVG